MTDVATTEYLRVPIDLLDAHAPVERNKVECFRSLLRQGLQPPPIWARRQRGSELWTVLNGQHRLAAAAAVFKFIEEKNRKGRRNGNEPNAAPRGARCGSC